MTPVASGDVKIIADDASAPASTTARLSIPLLSQFYESQVTPPIINSTKTLKSFSAGVYLVSALAFALLVYSGVTTTQEVSVTMIVPTTNGLEDGFVCKSLGRYSGSPYDCLWTGDRRPGIGHTICNPSRPPVNCPGGNVVCTGDAESNVGFYSSVSGWRIRMENVYFASFADCVSKIGSLVNETLAHKVNYVYSFGGLYLEWPYSGSVSIGDNTAQLTVALTFSLRSYDGGRITTPFINQTNIPSCASDATNYNADGTVITDSAVDILAKSLNGDLLQSAVFSDGPNCPTRPTPENICQPFRTIGPYSCVKTSKITQPFLQVLGSSLSNAATLMTILSIALAWIIKKIDERAPPSRKAEEKVVPKPDTAVVAAKE